MIYYYGQKWCRYNCLVTLVADVAINAIFFIDWCNNAILTAYACKVYYSGDHISWINLQTKCVNHI